MFVHHAVYDPVVPGWGLEARRHVGEGENSTGDQELEHHRNEEQSREVDEGNHIDKEFGGDEEDPGDEL